MDFQRCLAFAEDPNDKSDPEFDSNKYLNRTEPSTSA